MRSALMTGQKTGKSDMRGIVLCARVGGAGCEFSQGEDSPTRENPVKLDLKPDLVAER